MKNSVVLNHLLENAVAEALGLEKPHQPTRPYRRIMRRPAVPKKRRHMAMA